MNTAELEGKVQALDEMDLVRFGVWFDAYREQRLPDACPDADDDDDDVLSAEQRSEIDRRLAELDADPSLAEPWEGTIERVKARLEELRCKTSVHC